MKKLILLGTALLLLIPIIYAAPDNTSLVAYWSFEDNTLNVANGTHNLIGTSVEYIEDGINNKAVDVVKGNAPSNTAFTFPDTNSNTFTYYMWINCTSLPSSPKRAFNWKDNAADEYIQIYSAITYFSDFGGSPDVVSLTYNTSWGLGWTHIAIVKETGSKCWVYFNGTAVASSFACSNFGNVKNNFVIGGDSASGNLAECDIDEASLYSVAHTESEVNEMYNSGTGRFYPFGGGGDTTPPNLFNFNCTSYNPPNGDNESPYTTEDTTPTFTFNTDENARCRVFNQDLKWSSMPPNDCSGNDTQSFTCTLPVADKFNDTGVNYLYMGCKDSSNNENTTSSSGPLLIDITGPSEAGGDEAVQIGIETSEIWPSATVYNNQQVYGRNLSNGQFTGTFDRLAVLGSKRWALNYVSDGESAITGLFNITPVLYVLQLQNQTNASIINEISSFINSTYP